MGPLDILGVIAGAVLVAGVLSDLFQSVVLPRPAIGKVGLARLTLRPMWALWRAAGMRARRAPAREAMLSSFGPLSVLALMVVWATAILLGYALMFYALRDQWNPQPQGFFTTLYFSAESLLTIGFGDYVPVGAAARVLVPLEAATGLAIVALVISQLFSIFSSFQRRESAVVTLDALAGAPPSGLHLLETCGRDEMPQQLEKTFDEWRGWSADVLESHLAYPVLMYFRSSHDNEAWLNSFGAVMDAATLVLTAIEGGPTGPARLLFKVGVHLVEDVSWYFHYGNPGGAVIEREEFDEACERLRAVGYRVRGGDHAWERFAELRGAYALPLNRLARHLAIVPAPWIGDRSYLPHTDTRRRRARAPRPGAGASRAPQ